MEPSNPLWQQELAKAMEDLRKMNEAADYRARALKAEAEVEDLKAQVAKLEEALSCLRLEFNVNRSGSFK